ncbi:hypothetical protein E0L21_23880 [Kosakonia quasisacchari]|uniref:Uncharacterized protein n=1 Tax=Kosakonia quasisacchari TaxID=2529380 RepID=A0A4R0GIS2_9ENTR|nr:hypothetical protein [Kosakonia quasisacchari]TCB96667.1 hypothetical protein E0L21_23880 [Kosakonia quasisacchari]
MSVNEKRDVFEPENLIAVDKKIQSLTPKEIKKIIKEVCDTVSRWEQYATNVELDESEIETIKSTHRLYFGKGFIKKIASTL